jgi:hypothetical protein
MLVRAEQESARIFERIGIATTWAALPAYLPGRGPEQSLRAAGCTHKPLARLIVSQVILETLKGLRMSYPTLDATKAAQLRKFRKALSKSS